MTCKLSSRTGDCVCMPFCVPGGTITIRSRIRTLGGIQDISDLEETDKQMAEPVTAQPQPIEGTLLVSTVQGHRKWTTGLFDCFTDCKTCVISYFCLPCMVCNLAVKLGDCACMPYVVPGSTVAMRTRLRTLGGIQGSICNDCLVMGFCEPCAICQMSRELNNMGIK
ncbi:unnamed protein product [Mytilus coruscus]|uniref:PLAC8 n=1 Tax=Mytilus coruscus TaxID=42192 RepID=A0A6J8EZQ8_MYTCO|nr:unnamed protein product [Mytilus coruscus]